MSQVEKFWSGQRILERWGISPTELAAFIYQGLPAYRMAKGKFDQIKSEEVNQFDMDSMTDLVFLPTHIKDFEQANDLSIKDESDGNNVKLSAKDAREFGRLKAEQEKWYSSITAAVQVGIFCSTVGHSVVRREIEGCVFDIDQAIPFTTIDIMWRAIPDKYKKGAGRPRKE